MQGELSSNGDVIYQQVKKMSGRRKEGRKVWVINRSTVVNQRRGKQA